MKKNGLLPLFVLFTLLTGIILTACAPLTPQAISTASPAPAQNPTLAAPTQTATPPAADATRAPDKSEVATKKALLVTTLTTPVVGEVPAQIMNSVLKELERRIGMKPENVNIIRSEFVTWSDGSMGCPKPGMSYTLATIDGYWVVLQVNSKQYDFRVNARGTTVMLCER